MTGMLDQQVAWITGAASGIGKAIAVRLAAEGAQIVAVDRDEAALKTLSGFDGFHLYICDVADAVSVKAMTDAATRDVGAPHILVNAAGIFHSHELADHDEAAWQRVLAINLGGPFHLLRELMPGMMARGYGRIINISSGSGVMLSPNVAAYGSSKAGVIALTKAAALESARFGVTANVIAPGLVDTPMTRVALGGAEGLQAIADDSDIANPMGLVMTPDDIAQAAAFLADPRSRAITGQVIHVNAGNLMP